MQRVNNDSTTPAGARRRAGRTALGATATLLLLAISAVPASAKTKNLIAVINGGQAVPPTSSSALGNAFLTFDTDTKMLCFAISFTDLDGAEFATHFHLPASAGETAPPVFTITPAILPEGSPKNGCVGPFDEDSEKALNRGQVYINIHSTFAPPGEIRGQVIRVKGK